MIDRDGISLLSDDIKAQLTYLTKKVGDLISTKSESIRAIKHVDDAYNICDLKGHTNHNCPILPTFREALHEQASELNTFLILTTLYIQICIIYVGKIIQIIDGIQQLLNNFFNIKYISASCKSAALCTIIPHQKS